MKKLDRDFYMRDTLTVARDLLGKLLVHETPEYRVAGRIVETEAYLGLEDKGAHSYEGLRTKRTEVMYGIGGTAYVFLIYGMYNCFNVVTREADRPEAVLVRAVEPAEGEAHMSQLRYGKDLDSLSPKQRLSICNGPGKLCLAMSIDKTANGLDLCGDKLYICDMKNEPFTIKSSPRINIDYAGEYARKPWRYYIEGNKYVSRG